MKICPRCKTRNQGTNLFCPICGYSFVPDSAERAEEKSPPENRRRRSFFIALTVIVVLGLAAGLTSFFISLSIWRSTVVTVETGIRWRCSECGEIYKERIVETTVKESEKDQYKVETVEGECYRCRYGPLVGDYQDFFDVLSDSGAFGGIDLEIHPGAARFMQEHPDLFPADTEERVREYSAVEDLSQVAPAFDAYAGSLLEVEGTVLETEPLEARDGSQMTCLRVSPTLQEGSPVELTVFYPGVSGLTAGDRAVFYVLPVAAFRKEQTAGGEYRVVAVGTFIASDGEP